MPLAGTRSARLKVAQSWVAMVSSLLIASSLMALCVTIHAWGIAAALQRLRRAGVMPETFWSATWLFIVLAIWMVFLHLCEISTWALFYSWTGAMPDLQAAVYFSAITYTTTGYGDFVLPADWRLIGGVEALTGILMCGWSTGFFFAIVNRFHERQRDDQT
jgi:hypothetical protein